MSHQHANLLSQLASVFFAALLCNLAFGFTVGDRTAFAVPPAPTPLTPVDGALGPVPFTISWSAVTDPSGASAVPGAPTYRLETSNDPNFPLGTVPPGIVTFWNDNIRGTVDAYVHSDSLGEGTFYARVFATDSDFARGIRSLPSNVIQYTVFFNNPIGPAPVLVSPINNPTLTLPVTLTWAHITGNASVTVTCSKKGAH